MTASRCGYGCTLEWEGLVPVCAATLILLLHLAIELQFGVCVCISLLKKRSDYIFNLCITSLELNGLKCCCYTPMYFTMLTIKRLAY